jgi:uncharacterized protein (TIGR00369 family)
VTTESPIAGRAGGDPRHNGHSHCLVCGNRNPWSLGLCFHPTDDGTVDAEFRAHPELQGYDGILHGGVIASLLDSAMTHCLFHRGVKAVTGDLHIRFLEPVSCESNLRVRATVLSHTPPLFRLRAELFSGERLMAWAAATFMEVGKPEGGSVTSPGLAST